MSPAVQHALITRKNALYRRENNTAEKYVTLLEDDLVCRKVNVSGQMSCNITRIFNKESPYTYVVRFT